MKKTILSLIFSIVCLITSYGYNNAASVTATAASDTYNVNGFFLHFQKQVNLYANTKNYYWYHPTFFSHETNQALGFMVNNAGGWIGWSSTNPVPQVYLEGFDLAIYASGECDKAYRSYASATLYVTW